MLHQRIRTPARSFLQRGQALGVVFAIGIVQHFFFEVLGATRPIAFVGLARSFAASKRRRVRRGRVGVRVNKHLLQYLLRKPLRFILFPISGAPVLIIIVVVVIFFFFIIIATIISIIIITIKVTVIAIMIIFSFKTH